MADNVSNGLPKIGKTYHGGTPASIGRSVNLEGTEHNFPDDIRVGNEPRRARSGRFRVARLVRNSAAIALQPKRVVRWKAGYRGKRVDGYCAITSQEAAGVVDPDLPSTGAAIDDLFWVFRQGPTLMLTPLAGDATNVFTEGDILVALTAATSGATTAGRVGVAALTTSVTGTTDGSLSTSLANRLGRAMSAKTTANTNADILVDLYLLS